MIGGISVNGVALSDYRLEDQYGCGYWPSDGEGQFSSYFPAGPRTVKVLAPTGFIGTFSFEVVTGETTDTGVIDFPSRSCPGSGDVEWRAHRQSHQRVYLYIPGLLSKQVNTAAPSPWTRSSPAPTRLASTPTTAPALIPRSWEKPRSRVVAGATSNVDIDTTATAGRVIGGISVNGVALSDYRLEDQYGCGYWPSDGEGQFSSYFPAGPRTVKVLAPTGFIGTFSFEVVTGETTDTGRCIDFPTGAVQGAVTWNGAPIANPNQRVYLYIPGLLSKQVNTDGTFAVDTVQPGTYTFGVYANHCPGADYEKLGEAEIEVVAGATSNVDIDTTATAGRVIGGISVNGVALSDYRLEDQYGCGYWPSDGEGQFSSYFPAGPRTVKVLAPTGFIGTFSFEVVTGETTDVDFGTTQVGSDVEVELSGGLETDGGLAITFDSVTTGGNTTVVESGFGPPPPTGYQLVGLDGADRYWDIDTTATFEGAITVCIHYDEDELTNPEAEGSIVLMHDAGSGFEDITTTLDTDADIVCGETTSLSPFAVMVSPNRPPHGVDDSASTTQDVILNVPAPGVLGNDEDA